MILGRVREVTHEENVEEFNKVSTQINIWSDLYKFSSMFFFPIIPGTIHEAILLSFWRKFLQYLKNKFIKDA